MADESESLMLTFGGVIGLGAAAICKDEEILSLRAAY